MLGCRKTLQGIALLWTLLQSGHEQLGGAPLAKRVIICCPTSLVSNWDSECTKWLKARRWPFIVHAPCFPLQTQHRMVEGGDVLHTGWTGCMAVQGRVRTLALSESSREDVISSVKDFLNPKAYYQVTPPRLSDPHARLLDHLPEK